MISQLKKNHLTPSRERRLYLEDHGKSTELTTWRYLWLFCCSWLIVDSKLRTKVSSGVLWAVSNARKTEGKESTFLWAPSGISVTSSPESMTVFAASGSRKKLNSEYLFEGTVKTFPLSSPLSTMCPPTMKTLCRKRNPDGNTKVNARPRSSTVQ